MVKQRIAIPARSSPGVTRTAQPARELGQAVTSGRPEPAENVVSTRHSQPVGLLVDNPFESSSSNRKRWSKDENKALMRCYYKAATAGRGYMRRLAEEWQLVYPHSNMSAHSLAVRKRAILSQNLLTQLELEEIQRSTNEVEVPAVEVPSAVATPTEPPPVIDISHQMPTNDINLNQEEVDLKEQILLELQQLTPDCSSRSYIPILAGRKQLQSAVDKANKVLSTLDYAQDITTINQS